MRTDIRCIYVSALKYKCSLQSVQLKDRLGYIVYMIYNENNIMDEIEINYVLTPTTQAIQYGKPNI